MLAELSIKNFAIIDNIKIEFKDGLTVLTGETGAGKSIIIDAIQLLTGGRGSVDFVRHGSEKAEIEGLFFLERNRVVVDKAIEFGIDLDGEDTVILHRTITSAGKSICRINGKLVTLAILKEIGQLLIDIHSQHETQSLMDTDLHLSLLDHYASHQLKDLKREYREMFTEYKRLRKRYIELSENEQEVAHRLDLLKFQHNELQQANLQPNEDTELDEERHQLMNYEKIYQSVSDAYESLYGEQKGLEWLSQALTSLQNVSEFDQRLESRSEELSNHYYLIEEMAFELRNQLDEMEFDPERLNEIEARLNEINHLKRKYGHSVEQILQYYEEVEEEIEQLENKDVHLAQLEKQLKEMSKDILQKAEQLHEVRKLAAETLRSAIKTELKDLYLEKADFAVSFMTQPGQPLDPERDGERVKLTEDGFDYIEFLISPNPGEPLKGIGKIASGGELSRFMLAIKNIFARHQGITSVIFDEVDTGVSGRVAQAIAEKIYVVSEGSQVLCISHLPQVAAMADTHLLIEKTTTHDRTVTTVSELTEDAKVEEISRMITGAELTETTKDHAKELINLAQKHKVS
ncbi:DNA repair protein RecN [Salirhabdus salicampi]|uniref:DNA repair protein RecN n=1 Tax=Salirhabdus salicampi TaxID=476102 RepID=UPI0020C48BA6|nr:DNA repair protein RecN [Salirhabdus salicampi]